MIRFKALGAATVLAAGFATATGVNAAPFGYGPSEYGVVIEHVAGGCGPGFHPNPWGRCRPNDRGYGGGYGGPRGFYSDRPAYGYRGGYGGYDRGYPEGGPRRFYGGY
ncbi:hypothetical protein FV232_04620 [Methylobacterium sp. WL30]|uniref:GCG_CRPN prefix-to-repeats domain-containing protein n=1 Tax=unclassified Methylobacterium TaxID=2615210 RepID=UPI0011C7E5B5|nr:MULTISPECIES: hypothetical protein [unclassified Methylobacterium]TXM92679.1 hypothetical protein FV223_10965 [Methylobacterium sp. WL116]TXN41538.1 hypothetical protein FV225_02025 [Methylobacterium sp. WL93]TXN52454.1 hypothetical protein FV227_03160 [Methylobacterium sp. WL119]TXN69743.1 hypothetical protein FV232_04620 [Methylobacterium sp. WL30]